MVIREERSACLEMISEVYWGLNKSPIQREKWGLKTMETQLMSSNPPAALRWGDGRVLEQTNSLLYLQSNRLLLKQRSLMRSWPHWGRSLDTVVRTNQRTAPFTLVLCVFFVGVTQNWQSPTLTFQEILTLVVWEPAWATLRSDTKIYVRCQDGNRSISAVKWSNLWWHLQQGPSQWNWGDNDSFKY